MIESLFCFDCLFVFLLPNFVDGLTAHALKARDQHRRRALVDAVQWVLRRRHLLGQASGADGQGHQHQRSNAGAMNQRVLLKGGCKEDRHPNGLLRKDVQVAAVAKRTLHTEPEVVRHAWYLQLRIALRRLERPLLLIGQGLQRKEQQKQCREAGSTASDRSCSKERHGNRDGPEQENLEHGDKQKAEDGPHQWNLKHGPRANVLPAVVFTAFAIPALAVEVERQANTPRRDQLRKDNTHREQGCVGLFVECKDPGSDDGEDGPQTVHP